MEFRIHAELHARELFFFVEIPDAGFPQEDLGTTITGAKAENISVEITNRPAKALTRCHDHYYSLFGFDQFSHVEGLHSSVFDARLTAGRIDELLLWPVVGHLWIPAATTFFIDVHLVVVRRTRSFLCRTTTFKCWHDLTPEIWVSVIELPVLIFYRASQDLTAWSGFADAAVL